MNERQNRPLDSVCPVLLIDCVHVQLWDGKVANRLLYMVLAVTVEGTREILGLWAGYGGEGAKYWLQVLTEIKNHGTEDVCMVVCDGSKGLPDAIGLVWPRRSRRPVSFTRCGPRSVTRPGRTGTPGGCALWENAWAEFVPFLQFVTEIRRIVCTTNAIESVHARIRKAVRARGHFPTSRPPSHASMAIMSQMLDPALESSAERLRHHLRRPALSRPPLNPPTTPKPPLTLRSPAPVVRPSLG